MEYLRVFHHVGFFLRSLAIVPINNPQISMEAKPVRDAAKAETAGALRGT